MKKAIHWLDEYLQELLMVVFLIAMTLIMGIQVFSRYVLGMSLIMVGGNYQVSFHMVGFLKCQPLYPENAYL